MNHGPMSLLVLAFHIPLHFIVLCTIHQFTISDAFLASVVSLSLYIPLLLLARSLISIIDSASSVSPHRAPSSFTFSITHPSYCTTSSDLDSQLAPSFQFSRHTHAHCSLFTSPAVRGSNTLNALHSTYRLPYIAHTYSK